MSKVIGNIRNLARDPRALAEDPRTRDVRDLDVCLHLASPLCEYCLGKPRSIHRKAKLHTCGRIENVM